MSKSKVKILLVRDYYAQELLAQLRDPNTLAGGRGQRFYHIGLEFSQRLLHAALGAFAPTESITIQTRLAPACCRRIRWDLIHGVYVRRAGAVITDALRHMHHEIPTWCIDLHRDEQTFEPIEGSHHHLPKRFFPDDFVLLCDPMLATGGTADWSITRLKQLGAQHIISVGWISAPDGFERIQRRHPDVPIVLGARDAQMNAKKYIVPGFGDAGDLLFGGDKDEFGSLLVPEKNIEDEETRILKLEVPVAGLNSGKRKKGKGKTDFME